MLDTRCVTTTPMLRGRDIAFNVLAGTVEDINFTVPTDRGDLVGFDLVLDSAVSLDLIQFLWTLEVNGISILERRNGLWHSTLYANKETFVPVVVEPGSTIEGALNNPSANDIRATVMTFFNGNEGGNKPVYQR